MADLAQANFTFIIKCIILKDMRKNILNTGLAIVAILVVLGGGYALGYRVGNANTKNVLIQVRDVANMNAASSTVGAADFGAFWQAWQLVNNDYLRYNEVNGETKVRGAINGLVGSLGDPYSEFFSPEDSKKFQEDVQGNFGGIGAELGMKKDQLVVIAPLKDTPASRAGLKADDEILQINSSSTEGILIEEAVNLIRGPIGTKVKLTIYREGWDKSKDLDIIRDKIIIPTVDVSTVGGNLTRLELHSFNDNATQLFYDAIVKAINGGSKGLVLDLRDDPGGYLEVATRIAGWFLPKGAPIVSEEGRDKKVFQSFKADDVGAGALADFPVVVLINKGSASASEILAGALRDSRKVKLVGETSFGKGTVQQFEDLADGSSIKLTVAHWVLPSGHILENGGLKPDVEVKITDDDIAKKKDPQLDKAVEVLEKEISKK
jgi:carboxyl-terminal processing protease